MLNVQVNYINSTTSMTLGAVWNVVLLKNLGIILLNLIDMINTPNQTVIHKLENILNDCKRHNFREFKSLLKIQIIHSQLFLKILMELPQTLTPLAQNF